MTAGNITISPVNVEHRKNLDIRAGDTVRVSVKVQEKGKTRLQAFEGIVLARKHGSEPGATFTVRKVASGVGVERIFPLYSPNIEKIELVRRAKTRRSKLYYIREKAAKAIRKKMKFLISDVSFNEEPTTDNLQPTTNDEDKKNKEEREELSSDESTDEPKEEAGVEVEEEKPDNDDEKVKEEK